MSILDGMPLSLSDPRHLPYVTCDKLSTGSWIQSPGGYFGIGVLTLLPNKYEPVVWRHDRISMTY